MDTYQLDAMLDAEQTLPIGAEIDWHGHTGELIRMKNGSPAIRVTIPCGLCEVEEVEITVISGCHNGAFCYVVDDDGNVLADLRNQTAACHKCS